MTASKLYLRRLTTPSGNVAHEVVALVSAEAVERARQSAEDARRRARDAQRRAELRREHEARVARSKAIWDAAEAWRLDNLNRAIATLDRIDALLVRTKP